MRKSLAAAIAAVLAMATMLTGCGGGTASRKMQEAEQGSSAASDVVINEVVSSNKYSYMHFGRDHA